MMKHALEAQFVKGFEHILNNADLTGERKAQRIMSILHSEQVTTFLDPDVAKELRNTLGRKSLARLTGLTEGIAQRIIKNARKGSPMTSDTLDLKDAIDVNVFIEKNDMNRRVYKGLEKLQAALIPDIKFRDALSVSAAVWASLREKDEFKKFQITIRGKLYWAQPEVIGRIKTELDYL